MKIKFLMGLVAGSILFPTTLSAKTDKYRLSWRTNPATSMVVCWNQIDGDKGTVYYGTKDFGSDWKKYPFKHGVDRQQEYGVLNSRFSRLTKLKPDTAYYFVIKDSNSISSRFWFKTAPSKPQKVSFIAGGDSRTHHEPRKEGNRLVAKLRPLFILFGGDYTNRGRPSEWATWLDHWQLTTSKDGRMYPIIAAHGNHENTDMQMVYKLFDAPNSDMYFALNVGGDMMRLWTLNSELDKFPAKWAEQLDWIKRDFASNKDIKWKIADYHKPMRPHTAYKSEGEKMYQGWAELFYKNGVDLVVESDTHMIKRTYPIRPSKEAGSSEGFIIDPKGTVYIGEGSWGAPTRPVNDDKPWTLASASFYQFKWIHVSPKKLESRVIKFENVDKVKDLTEKNLFTIPENLEIWEPDTGAVLTLPFSEKTLTLNKPKAIILPGSEWKFDDSKSFSDNSWTKPEFDDSNWKEGKSPLGYGEDDLATTLNYGTDSKNKPISARFRKTFEIKDTARKVRIKVRRDDGVIIYLNGKKVISDSMPGGEIKSDTKAKKLAHGSNEDKFFEFTLPGKVLINGKNSLAVSVHQIKPTSSDLLFDLALEILK